MPNESKTKKTTACMLMRLLLWKCTLCWFYDGRYYITGNCTSSVSLALSWLLLLTGLMCLYWLLFEAWSCLIIIFAYFYQPTWDFILFFSHGTLSKSTRRRLKLCWNKGFYFIILGQWPHIYVTVRSNALQNLRRRSVHLFRSKGKTKYMVAF